MEVLHNGSSLGVAFEDIKEPVRPAVSCIGLHKFGTIFNSEGEVGVKHDDNSLRTMTLRSKFERFKLGSKFWLFADANKRFSRAAKIRNFQLMDVYLSPKEAASMRAAGSRLLDTSHLYRMTQSLRSMSMPVHWAVRGLVAAKGDHRRASDWLILNRQYLELMDMYESQKKLATLEAFRGFSFKFV